MKTIWLKINASYLFKKYDIIDIFQVIINIFQVCNLV